MTRRIWDRYGLLLGLLTLALFKLWVVHTEEIYGSSTEYDALWYVGSAKHWYWGATYNWTAFVRPCAYPLFIAVLHFCGIPLRLGIESAQMGGFLVLIAALRKGGVPRLSVGMQHRLRGIFLRADQSIHNDMSNVDTLRPKFTRERFDLEAVGPVTHDVIWGCEVCM